MPGKKSGEKGYEGIGEKKGFEHPKRDIGTGRRETETPKKEGGKVGEEAEKRSELERRGDVGREPELPRE